MKEDWILSDYVSSKIDLLVVVIISINTLILIPFLFIPLPSLLHIGVSSAGYFQTLALVVDGLGSYYYLTPAESGASLHLHSLLSAVLFKIGIFEAGRFVSLLSAIATSTLLALLSVELYNRRVAVLSVALFYVYPLVPIFATRWYPEMLGMALVTAAVAAAVFDRTRGGNIWYIVCLLCIFLGITNHLWEASVAAPVVILYTHRKKATRIPGVVLVTIVSIVFVELVKGLQPKGPDLVSAYSLLSNPRILFSSDWLFHGDIPNAILPPLGFAVSITVPLTLFGLLMTGIWYTRFRTEREALLFAWLGSGLTILILLPKGWIIHDYYLWAVLVPLALFGGLLIERGVKLGIQHIDVQISKVSIIIFISIFLLVISNIGMYETRRSYMESFTDIRGYDNEELIQTGRELRTVGIEKADNIVFVGNWSSSSGSIQTAAVRRVLIYGKVLIKDHEFIGGDHTPRYATNMTAVNQSDCSVMIIRSQSEITIEACS
jgi:hypothetical protein